MPKHSSIPELISHLSTHTLRAEEAWNEFFQRFDPWIHRMVQAAARRLRSQYVANEISDLVQQVYCRLLDHDRRALRNFRGTTEQDLKAYLAIICCNWVRDYRQSADTKTALFSEIAKNKDSSDSIAAKLAVEPDQERAAQERNLRACLEESLTAVLRHSETPQRDRLVFVLRYFDGYSAKEVAQVLKIHPDYVHLIYHRLTKRMAIHLSRTLGAKGGHATPFNPIRSRTVNY